MIDCEYYVPVREGNKTSGPRLGLNGKEEEHCGYFNKPLNCNKELEVIKCDECKLMTRMLIAESEVEESEVRNRN